MAFNLIEASKLQEKTILSGIMLTLAKSTPVMEKMRWMDIAGRTLEYNQQIAVSGVGFRDINGTLHQSNLVLQNSVEVLRILEAKAEVDRALIKTRIDGDKLRKQVLTDKVAALAYKFTYDFFKGDVATDPLGFDGLEKRLTGRQVVDCAGALTLEALDDVILRVSGPNSQKTMYVGNSDFRKIKALVRKEGTEIVQKNSFGQDVLFYGDVEIARIDTYERGDQETGIVETVEILGKNETFNGVANTSSIYVVRHGDGENGVTGIQNQSGIDVYQDRVLQYEVTDVEWIVGFGIFQPRAAARLAGIQ